MRITEKVQLSNLLALYQTEIMTEVINNQNKIEKNKKANKYIYGDCIEGLKAKYNHARILKQKIDKEIGDAIPPFCYELEGE